VVTSLQKIFPDSYKLLGEKNFINLALAKNEYESAQVVLFNANKKLTDVKVECSGLVNKTTGERIAAENIECALVMYVKTKKPDYDVERSVSGPIRSAIRRPSMWKKIRSSRSSLLFTRQKIRTREITKARS